MEEIVGKTVDNKQIIFKGYIDGRPPKETDMEIIKDGNKIKVEAPKGSGSFLVKNLYLSCDPYMRGRMRNFHGSYIPPFLPGSVNNNFFFPFSLSLSINPFWGKFVESFA